MSESPFKKAVGGGEFFKPADNIHDIAIVIEAKKILRDQPHEYQGVKTTRDVAIADIACFRNSQDVATATPSAVFKGAQITAGILVADIERNDWLGVPAVTVIRKPKQAYVYRNEVSADAEAAAAKWYSEREAKRESAAADMPEL